jgi:hypothetical protein
MPAVIDTIATLACLLVMLWLTVHWPAPADMLRPTGFPPVPPPPHPGCMDCENTVIPPCAEHRVRDLTGMSPAHTERIVYPIPVGDQFHLLDAYLWPDGPQGGTNPTTKG